MTEFQMGVLTQQARSVTHPPSSCSAYSRAARMIVEQQDHPLHDFGILNFCHPSGSLRELQAATFSLAVEDFMATGQASILAWQLLALIEVATGSTLRIPTPSPCSPSTVASTPA